jgi:S-adenosylmethionine hydrolase
MLERSNRHPRKDAKVRHLLADFKGLLLGVSIALSATLALARTPLVLMTDFGQADGAVSAMRGVAFGVDAGLNVADLTHEIPEYDIWTGAYRLFQTASYWPVGSVFVTVVDPGVGTQRKSVVLKTRSGQFYVGPNNGLYTLVAERDGVEALREIDESVNRLPGSADSYTFHGRDVYAYTGARLASGQIAFEQVGPVLDATSLVRIAYQAPTLQADRLEGNIPVLDVNYGNVWSNIPKSLLDRFQVKVGDRLRFRLFKGQRLVADVVAPFGNSFGDVPTGKPVAYLNSLLNLSVAINQGNFAKVHKVQSGADWRVDVRKVR